MPEPRNLLTEPLWREEDLGAPVPDSPHATSVAMPLWQHVVGYEEKQPEVINKLRAGYPRFAIHPSVRSLWLQAEQQHAPAGHGAMVLPSLRAGERCKAFLWEKEACEAQLVALASDGLCAVLFPEAVRTTALRFWQHFGDVVSSRRAEAALAEVSQSVDAPGILAALRQRIAQFAATDPANVYLYSSGMGAMAAALRVLRALAPEKKTVQLGFPYVDGLKMQTVCGPGAHFLPVVDDAAYETIGQLAASGEIAGVFCETPGNPLLLTPDLPRLSALLRPHGVPLVVDDTVASFYNVDVLPWADLLASSLTKLVSGVGDVMAGSLIVSTQSPLADTLAVHAAAHHEELLWEGDARALEENARDYPARAERINAHTLAVAEYLRQHPAVEQVWYPAFSSNTNYETIRRAGGGYGSLFSLVLKHGAETAEPFYDRLRITKGPSLGTNFSLACPYTLLAHYDELDWAESLGISRWLVRVSIGLESADDLIARFEEALPQVG